MGKDSTDHRRVNKESLVTNAELKKLIVDEFKAEGMDIAEDVAVRLVKAAFKVLPKVVLATDNKMDDLLIPLLAVVEKPVLQALDKINGHEG